MKYLKSYKLFEFNNSEIVDYIKDIFLELEDNGYEVKINGIGNTIVNAPNPHYIRASVSEELTGYEVEIKKARRLDKPHRNYFLLRNVLDTILMCGGYLKDNGYSIDEVEGLVSNPGLRKSQAGRLERRNLDYIKKLDPEIDYNELESNNLFDINMYELKLIIRKDK